MTTDAGLRSPAELAAAVAETERAPVEARATPVAPPGGAMCPPVARRVLRILVTDDNAFAADLMLRLLAQDGHAVRTAGSIAEAVALVGAGGIDVLITDYHLPDGTGCELLRRLRDRDRDCDGDRDGDGCRVAAISVTGFNDPEHARHIAAAGFDARLVKPITLAQLTAALAQVAVPAGATVP